MYRHSDRFPFLSGAYYLSHYVPRSQGGNDELSSYLLQFKDNNHTAVKKWSEFAAVSLRRSGVNFKVIVRALGSSETTVHTGTPLDHLGQTIAGELGAVYMPKLLSKSRQNKSLKYLSAVERAQELTGLYSFNNYGAVSGDNLLLIDDVVTTGTTLKSIYNAIAKSCPDVNVYFFSLAKTFDSWRDVNNNSEIFTQMVGQKKNQSSRSTSALVNHEESEPDWDLMERIFQDSVEEYSEPTPTPTPTPTPPSPNLVRDGNGWKPANGYEWVNPEGKSDFTVRKKEIIPPGPNLVRHGKGWRPKDGYIWSKTNSVSVAFAEWEAEDQAVLFPENKWEVIKTPTPPGPNLVLYQGGWKPAKGYVWSKKNPNNKWEVTKEVEEADLDRIASEAGIEISKSGCFIATATMGDFNHPDVLCLRQLRDDYLLKRDWGQWFVQTYYCYSPPIAEYISTRGTTRTIIRILLIKPLASLVRGFWTLFRHSPT